MKKNFIFTNFAIKPPTAREAVRSKNLIMLEQLLKNGEDPNKKAGSKGGTILHYVAYRCDYEEIARLVLRYGANINEPDINGDTPLHVAVFKKNKQAIKFFLENGSDCTIKNSLGKTAKDLASEKRPDKIATLLSPEPKQIHQKKLCSFPHFFKNPSYRAILPKPTEDKQFIIEIDPDYVLVGNKPNSF
ncbi:MAG: ankyrin repeat domain-containing protein [Rickettsia endosymbiont of Ixodes persulcatus]|nr:ankyrin repeat domain-containing protein [Rickettsia endosymbiont of Ixodes persulcatus]